MKVLQEVEQQLADKPSLETRGRKVLRPSLIAPWQPRIGDIRVFYDIEEKPEAMVSIKAIGKKVHNELWIGGEKIRL